MVGGTPGRVVGCRGVWRSRAQAAGAGWGAVWFWDRAIQPPQLHAVSMHGCRRALCAVILVFGV